MATRIETRPNRYTVCRQIDATTAEVAINTKHPLFWFDFLRIRIGLALLPRHYRDGLLHPELRPIEENDR